MGGTHQSQSAVPAHAVSEDADPLTVHLLEILEDGLGQLGRDVAVHLVAFVPGGFGRVEVEGCAGAEVEGVVFALDFEPTCGSREGLSCQRQFYCVADVVIVHWRERVDNR